MGFHPIVIPTITWPAGHALSLYLSPPESLGATL